MLKQNTKQTKPGKPHRLQRGNQYGRGRPQGSRNKATIILQALLEGEGEAITRVAVERAKSGDATALRLCLERLISEKKDRMVTLNFGSIETTTGVAQALDTLLQAVGSGEITPSEALAAEAFGEPDPYLRACRCQSVRLPHPVTAARKRVGGKSIGMDALEFPRTNSARPQSLDSGHTESNSKGSQNWPFDKVD
jgi:hypothetical protein